MGHDEEKINVHAGGYPLLGRRGLIGESDEAIAGTAVVRCEERVARGGLSASLKEMSYGAPITLLSRKTLPAGLFDS